MKTKQIGVKRWMFPEYKKVVMSAWFGADKSEKVPVRIVPEIKMQELEEKAARWDASQRKGRKR
jgi:hypothetical protein